MGDIRRSCDKCSKRIPPGKRSDAKYCSTRCSKAASQQRARTRKSQEALASGEKVLGASQNRSPDTSRDRLIVQMLSAGHFEELRLGRMTLDQVARSQEVNRSQVKRAVDDFTAAESVRAAQGGWTRSERTTYLLALDMAMPNMLDHDACQVWASAAMERFMEFEGEYFELPEGTPYLRERFHKKWIMSVLMSIATGGYLQILSPPRHGKSELLIHFCIWLISRNPDIRIMWVGPNIDISTDMVGSVADNLQENDQLIEDVLGPGIYFAPPKRGAGAIWKRTEFRVDCQRSTRKGKTMVAVSRGKKVLSKDCDLIVCDDIEDFDSTVQPSNRSNTRKWFGTGLDSRKEEHTALVVIGSRQHPDDLYSYNLDDPNFTNIVDSAHDPLCGIDPDDWEAHIDCMLFPHIRTYRWLMSKKFGAGARDESGIYEMVYLNDPQSDGYAIFSTDNIEASYNPSRGLGLTGIPKEGRRLIAGLDPSATGYQAGFCWAVTPSGRSSRADWFFKRWMVDLENKHGGGIPNALNLFQLWLDMYGVRYWVIEENGFQRGYRQDPRVKDFCRDNDVTMVGTQTQGANKNDPAYGVGAMSRLFPDLVDLPYADGPAKQKVDQFKRQAVRFTDDGQAQRRRQSDILMGSWFPQKTIRRWEKEAMAEWDEVDQEESYGFGIAYPNVGATNDQNLPWQTGYVT